MAKTYRQEATNTSTSSPHRTRSNKPNRRPRSLVPSSSLLSILATIAASSAPAHGSPAPPSFLCPFYDSTELSRGLSDDDEPSDKPLHLHPTTTKRRKSRQIPYKYEQGSDGRWRRVEYTLYGSTVCPECSTSSTSLPPPSVDDESQDSTIDTSSTSGSGLASPSATVDDILSSLPTGWTPSKPHETRRTVIILAVSMVFAFAICFFIIGCLFWRSNRRKKRHRDLEMRMKKFPKRDAEEDEQMILEKDARVKQKIWARATARWKANARYTARQRRGKRSLGKGTQAETSAVSLQPEDPVPSRAPSPSIPPLPSLLSVDVSRSSSPIPPSQNHIVSTSIPEPVGVPHLPPAYHRRSVMQSSPSINNDQTDFVPAENASGSNTPVLTRDYIHGAHVATDDKALLARLAGLASAPPSSPPLTNNGESSMSVSAPVWPEDDVYEYDANDESAPPPGQDDGPSPIISNIPTLSSPLPFPPPPESRTIKTYDYSLEDIALEFEPSAPPFQEYPNAPPLDEEIHSKAIPSAPPLHDNYSQSDLDDAWDDGHIAVPEEILTQSQAQSDRQPDSQSPSPAPDIRPQTQVQLLTGRAVGGGLLPTYHP